jgi:hypothetical protein
MFQVGLLLGLGKPTVDTCCNKKGGANAAQIFQITEGTEQELRIGPTVPLVARATPDLPPVGPGQAALDVAEQHASAAACQLTVQSPARQCCAQTIADKKEHVSLADV